MQTLGGRKQEATMVESTMVDSTMATVLLGRVLHRIPTEIARIATSRINKTMTAFLAWPKAKGVLEEALPPLPSREPHADGGRSC